MMQSNRVRRLVAGLVALLLLSGAAALWISADGRQVRATVPPPAAARDGGGAVSGTEEGDSPDGALLMAPTAPAKSREEKRFARIDRDDDGRISQAEFLAQRRRNFDKLDVNGDGRLSFEEYAASGIQKFHKADANGDGRLTAAEFATTAPKPAKARLAAANCPPVATAGKAGREGARPSARTGLRATGDRAGDRAGDQGGDQAEDDG